MTKEYYKILIQSFPKRKKMSIINSSQEILEFLNQLFPNVSNTYLKVYCLLRDQSPYCISCGNQVNSHGKKTCSIECRSKNDDASTRLKKTKNTMIEKYGVENAAKLSKTIDKRHATMIKKHGALTSEKSRNAARDRAEKLNEKGKETIFDKYGVTNASQITGHKEKCKTTLIKNYGVDNYYKSEEFLKLSEKKRFETYANFCPNSIIIDDITTAEEKLKMFDNPNRIIKFFCTNCNSNEAIPSETFKWRIRNNGTSCGQCGGNNNFGISKKETDLRDFVSNELGVEIKGNHRILPNNREIDIHVLKLKLGIEFNGLYWHNDLKLHKNYHKQKQDDAKNLGIRLIHIFEDEWDFKREIVKSRLRNVIGINNKIHARKCEVRKISTTIEKDFLIENHIQGYAKSSIKLGLYYENKLVSLMTFSKPNLSKGQKKKEGYWELLRFCSLLNTNVVGGASKLFSYFVKTYQPAEIISFADKRWSESGNIYKVLGFDFIHDTAINYWYVNLTTGERIHRFSLRKNENDDKSLTEYENRLRQGFVRIWDCGSSKWIWKAKK